MMKRLLFEYAKLIRLTGLGGLSLAPIFGALSIIDTRVTIDIKIIGVLLLLGIFKSIFGFVQNDYADIEVDKLSDEAMKRPLVTGTISKKVAIIICVICFVATFITAFVFFYRNHYSFYLGILCIVIAVIFGSIYNLYGKKFILSAFIAAMADALFVLVGAFFVSPDGVLNIFTWIIFILIFNQFLFMTTVIGGIKDADHDYLVNVKNVALASGVKITKDKKLFLPAIFKAYGFGIRLFSALILFVPFAFFKVNYELWELALLFLFAISVLILTAKLLNIKTLEKSDKIAKLAGLQGILRYCFVPIFLVPVIGLLYASILIIFPLVWYVIFIPLSGKKMLGF